MKLSYSTERRPPIPKLPVMIKRPYSTETLEVEGIVDSGSDITVITPKVANKLKLLPASSVKVAGFYGKKTEVPTYFAIIQVADIAELMLEVIALGDEVILGRDLLNRLNIHLKGKEYKLEVTDP